MSRKKTLIAVLPFVLMVVAVVLTGCGTQTSDDIPPALISPQLSEPSARGLVRMAAPDDTAENPATVVRVVDGDTVRVRFPNGLEGTLRLIGLDTPETVDPRKPVQCYGPEASAYAKSLLPPNSTVKVVVDPTQDLNDRYGRSVRSITMSNGDNFATAMIAEGYARTYVYDGRPDAHYADNLTAESKARQGQVGVWGPPCNGRSWGE